MKLTFEIPDQIALRFKSAIPPGKRSAFIAGLLKRRLPDNEKALIAACRKANRLNLDFSDWERLNESETW